MIATILLWYISLLMGKYIVSYLGLAGGLLFFLKGQEHDWKSLWETASDAMCLK